VMIDQFFWAGRLARLGVAPRPVPFARLSVERLAGAIRAALDDPAHREPAETLGRQIAMEDGAGRVAESVRHMFT